VVPGESRWYTPLMLSSNTQENANTDSEVMRPRSPRARRRRTMPRTENTSAPDKWVSELTGSLNPTMANTRAASGMPAS